MALKNKHLIGIFAIILLAVWGFSFLGKKSDAVKEKKEKTDENLSILQSLSSEQWDTPKPEVEKSQQYEIREKKFITDVIFEKNPVCTNEDFEVGVAAANPDGPLSELTYKIAGRHGNPAILRYKKPGLKIVHVFVRDSRENLDHRKVTVNVIECPEKPSIVLKADFSRTRADEGDFKVINKQGLSGKCSYLWEFGDGSTLTTGTAFASHNYGKREQTRFDSTFLAKVTVADEEGNTAESRASIAFSNIHWISNKMGHPIFPVIYERFPVREGNKYTVHMTIKNIYDSPIEFTSADVEYTSCNARTGKTQAVKPAASYITKAAIEANGITKDTLTFTQDSLPESTCGMLVKLKGTLSDERVVTGRLNLTIPMTEEEALRTQKGKIVTDEDLLEKISKAKKILGKNIITPAEIEKLEQKGLLN
ncbi:MAG: hypothetical protein GY754_17410 [bacterium]|nr:hypothetical protein [bacterium]